MIKGTMDVPVRQHGRKFLVVVSWRVIEDELDRMAFSGQTPEVEIGEAFIRCEIAAHCGTVVTRSRVAPELWRDDLNSAIRLAAFGAVEEAVAGGG